MKDANDIFGKFKDEAGEDYYCPINSVADDSVVSQGDIDNCVETTTAERYSGHLKIADRKIG